jgi:hypothetical protein
MTASTQGPGSETPVVRPAETTSASSPATPTGPGSVSSASGGAPLASPSTPMAAHSKDATSRPRAAADEARAAGDEAASAARGTADRLKHRARDAVDNAREKAREVAGEQKNVAAERLTGFADALRTASSDLDEQGQTVASAIVRQAADGLENVSGAMRSSNVDDLVGSVENFARRQPVIFLGSALLAGFGIARFMKSSSERRRGGRSSYETRGGYETSRGYGTSRGYEPSGAYDAARRAQFDRPADPGTPYGGTPYEGGL